MPGLPFSVEWSCQINYITIVILLTRGEELSDITINSVSVLTTAVVP